jgi:hypothetical protein
MSASRNRALDFIAVSYRDNPWTEHLLKAHPDLTSALYGDAEETAAKILTRTRADVTPDRRRLFTECVLDLELVSAFSVVEGHTGDPAIASCYIDAIVFEATGMESSRPPTDDEYRFEGTYRNRGIAKYRRAKQDFNVADPVAWLFAKEYAVIASGDALDFAYIAAVLPLTLPIRAHGRWTTGYWLTGKLPTVAEQNALAILMEKAATERGELLSD